MRTIESVNAALRDLALRVRESRTTCSHEAIRECGLLNRLRIGVRQSQIHAAVTAHLIGDLRAVVPELAVVPPTLLERRELRERAVERSTGDGGTGSQTRRTELRQVVERIVHQLIAEGRSAAL